MPTIILLQKTLFGWKMSKHGVPVLAADVDGRLLSEEKLRELDTYIESVLEERAKELKNGEENARPNLW